MRDDYGILTEGEDKAGYNTAADIAQVLGNLRKTHISAMISSPEDFKLALNTCRRIIDVISAKVPEKEITLLDEIVYSIEKNIPKAIETYRDQSKGGIYFKDVIFRVKIYRELESLYRILERLQNKFGYGMFSQEDPSHAIYKR